jgi:prepilin-type processing-associated H-X9-DG protein
MFSAAFEPESAFHAIFEAKNAESSGELLKLIDGGMRVLKKIGDETPIIRPLINTVLQAKPVATGNRITIDADLQKMTQLLAIPIQELREAARRTQCVNNLKQIGLAMHNFHDKHKTFPSAYTKGADGKPLLSWRVQILPFLDQNSLYKEFHQDEPWDSEHNRALISRMPTVFACPSGGSAVVKAGKTTYLAPRGRDTIFSGGDAVKIQAITDGTSNTIFVVDASDEAAVIWTKPDDWHVPDPVSVKGLVGHHPEGFNVSFADGSVRFLKGSILGKVLAALLTGSGGEVISSDAS